MVLLDWIANIVEERRHIYSITNGLASKQPSWLKKELLDNQEL